MDKSLKLIMDFWPNMSLKICVVKGRGGGGGKITGHLQCIGNFYQQIIFKGTPPHPTLEMHKLNAQQILIKMATLLFQNINLLRNI